MTVDPSGGVGEAQLKPGMKADRVGWSINAVCTINKLPRWNILELDQQYMSDPEFIDFLFLKNAQWSPYIIGIEKMPHLDTIVQKAVVERGTSLPIYELKSLNRKKPARIRALLPLLPMIYFAEHLDVEQRLRNWNIDMEHGDDAIDALAYQIDIAGAPGADEIKKRVAINEHREEQKRLAELPQYEAMEWRKWLKIRDRANEQVDEFDIEFRELIYGG